METTAHIPERLLGRYARRRAAPDEILLVQEHAASCPSCRDALTAELDFDSTFGDIRSAFSTAESFEHLPFEQLEGFVDGKLDAVDGEIAESHFAVCADCREDLAQLRAYREIAQAARSPEAHQQPKSLWGLILDLPRGALLAPVGALLIIGAVFGIWFSAPGTDSGQTVANANRAPAVSDIQTPAPIAGEVAEVPQIEDTPQRGGQVPETDLALNDGSLKLTDEGDARGLESLSPRTGELVSESLRSQKVAVANHPLGGPAGVLMGSRPAPAAGVPFGLVTPVGKIVKEAQPVLTWRPIAQAVNYSVAVVDEHFRVVAESADQPGTSWKPNRPLPRGANYSWQVTATLKDGTKTISPSNPAPQARFRVLEQGLADEIERAERTPARSHLALGVLYAKAGLRAEAKAEFEKLAKANPKSTLARRLLQSVK